MKNKQQNRQKVYARADAATRQLLKRWRFAWQVLLVIAGAFTVATVGAWLSSGAPAVALGSAAVTLVILTLVAFYKEHDLVMRMQRYHALPPVKRPRV